jgi:16S rRNA (guanine527-N7)-methyltransferase
MEYSKYPGMEEFQKGLAALGIDLTSHQKQQFIDYYELLIEWNKVMNLTAITEFEEVINKHFIDSLSLVKVLTPSSEKVLD